MYYLTKNLSNNVIYNNVIVGGTRKKGGRDNLLRPVLHVDQDDHPSGPRARGTAHAQCREPTILEGAPRLGHALLVVVWCGMVWNGILCYAADFGLIYLFADIVYQVQYIIVYYCNRYRLS